MSGLVASTLDGEISLEAKPRRRGSRYVLGIDLGATVTRYVVKQLADQELVTLARARYFTARTLTRFSAQWTELAETANLESPPVLLAICVAGPIHRGQFAIPNAGWHWTNVDKLRQILAPSAVCHVENDMTVGLEELVKSHCHTRTRAAKIYQGTGINVGLYDGSCAMALEYGHTPVSSFATEDQALVATLSSVHNRPATWEDFLGGRGLGLLALAVIASHPVVRERFPFTKSWSLHAGSTLDDVSSADVDEFAQEFAGVLDRFRQFRNNRTSPEPEDLASSDHSLSQRFGHWAISDLSELPVTQSVLKIYVRWMARLVATVSSTLLPDDLFLGSHILRQHNLHDATVGALTLASKNFLLGDLISHLRIHELPELRHEDLLLDFAFRKVSTLD